jgi:hypothetical protein
VLATSVHGLVKEELRLGARASPADVGLANREDFVDSDGNRKNDDASKPHILGVNSTNLTP